ncbi:hypothetical protein Pan216_52740 [Planctomycetes bacterium Pan216]|uniref:DUF1571 domain-containing protein n=1 Tax=Kolteria novifilia TaxID=2527975 RepID=A0A518BBL5_9BACT|nr:hypothetical protein Pan216_52740 [Planctomycetes bacterium Pan216]
MRSVLAWPLRILMSGSTLGFRLTGICIIGALLAPVLVLQAENSSEGPEVVTRAKPPAPAHVVTSAALPAGKPNVAAAPDGAHPIDQALLLLGKSEERLAQVADYETLFVMQERIGGTLRPPQYMQAKFRIEPFSIYLKWLDPDPGKEAIYVEGKNDNKIVTHTTGIAKALTGTLRIDPDSSLARKGYRHSLRDMGIVDLVTKLRHHWEFERQFNVADVKVTQATLNDRDCYVVTVAHPIPNDGRFMFHTAKVYFDKQQMLPIRIEGYEWPAQPGLTPGPLLESYTYLDLKVNNGLKDLDFSATNPEYSYSRF